MKKLTIFLAFLLFVGFQAAAQMQITGTVTGAEDGLSIPGVSVVVKDNPTIGTTTDIDGKYSLTVPSSAEAIVFSFVGMKEIQAPINGRTVIDIQMESDVLQMDEVIVTGYKTRRKEVLASAVSVIGAESMKALVPSTSIDNMLQGKAAGVDATALNGKPGQTATVKIRGAISLNTMGGDKSQPLYVIDGVFLDEAELNGINPNDIESMTVLKDAAAAAIYGSRAANGVIVISTKQGKSGDAKISFSSRFGIADKIDDSFDMMNTAEKIEYEEACGSTFTDEEKAELIGFDHDWQDDILKQSTIKSYSLSASGGSDNMTYFTSIGYDQNTGIVESLNGFERMSARLNLNSQLTEKFRLGTTTSVSHSTSDEPRDRNNVQNPIRAMYDYNPYTPVYQHDTDGDMILDDNGDPIYSKTKAGFPILEALKNNPESRNNSRFIGSMFANYEIIEGLNIETKGSGAYIRYKRQYYCQPGSVLDGYVGDPSAPGSKRDNGNDIYDWTWLTKLTYDKSFGIHNFNAILFNEYSEGGFHSYSLESKGYSSPLLTTQENSAEATDASTSLEEYAMWSVAGAIDYDYDGKYIAAFSLRRDGASRFGEDTKFGTFWSVALAWNIADEAFFSSLDFVDRCKLSASYGTLGSWNIPNYASHGYYSFGSYGGQTAAIINRNIGNPELTWESQKSMNIGLEFGLLKGRVNGAVDYYQNTRTDFLFENPLTWEGGAYTQYSNAGEMVTTGLELSLSGDIIRTQDFRWTIGGNITFIDYEVKELSGQDQIILNGIAVLKEGEEPFTFYLPRYAGVNPANGDALYYDIDGNVTNEFSSGDAVVLSDKSPLAKMFGGLNTYINYKGLDLSADFSFKYGNYVYNYMALTMLSDGDNSQYNQRKDALDFWQEPGDNKLPKLNGNSNHTTDRFLQDASYLRLRNVTIGYVLPKKWISKVKLDRVRIFASGQNLMTWTKFEGDPEVSIGSGDNQLGATDDFIPGLYALYSYPALRTYTFGIDINF